ncbi:hypothetical protein STEG23_015314, partial [Scotinomys teguina]
QNNQDPSTNRASEESLVNCPYPMAFHTPWAGISVTHYYAWCKAGSWWLLEERVSILPICVGRFHFPLEQELLKV